MELEFSGSILEQKREFGVRMVKWGYILSIQAQTIKIPLQSSEKFNIFPVLSLFFHVPPLTSGKPTPIKIIFSKINKDRSITLQS